MVIQFENYQCLVVKKPHPDGTMGIQLVDPNTHEPIASPTCPVAALERPIPKLKPEFVLVKDYSENTGMLEALTSQGVVEDLRLPIPTGFVNVWLCKLLV